MCVNEKIELFMAMRIRLAAAEAKRKGLHYVASTCCYGAGASSPQPPVHGCISACPPSCPDPRRAGMESSTDRWAGRSAPDRGCFGPCKTHRSPRLVRGVTLNFPVFWSRIPGAMRGWCDAGSWWLPGHCGPQLTSKPLGSVGLGNAGPIPARHRVRHDSQLGPLNSP